MNRDMHTSECILNKKVNISFYFFLTIYTVGLKTLLLTWHADSLNIINT